MKPIAFSCEAVLQLTPEEIVQQILDTANWPKFTGYGPIPGIQEASYEVRTPELIGSRIRVTNRDGSKHVEEIVVWEPNERLVLHMKEFSPPLSRLASRIEERWEFHCLDGSTRCIRAFQIQAISSLTRPMLWVVSILLKKAIARNLDQMRDPSR